MAANAATSASLPSPSSGTFLEISFRRLLKSCEEIMAGDNKGREDLTAWQSSPVFHHVSLHPSNVGLPRTVCHPCSCRVAAPELPSIDVPPTLSLDTTPLPCLQYVDTMQEQLADLETYTSRRYVQILPPHPPQATE